MSSISRDGQLQANVLKKFGYGIAYGSSKSSPVRALVGAIQKMRDGWDIALTVDGPTGPIYKVKPGALFLAKKLDAVIIPLTFTAKPSLILRSWDKYMLPKLFGKAVLICGNPIKLSKEMDEKTVQEESMMLEKVLNEYLLEADRKIEEE